MNTSHIPGPFDSQLLLEVAAGVTKTTTYDGATKDLGAGYAPGGIGQPAAAVVNVTDLETDDTSATYTATLQGSANGTDWDDVGPSVAITSTGAISVPGFLSQRYCRVKMTIAGATPSITYKAHLVPLGFPG